MTASDFAPRHLIFATDLSARCDRARDRAVMLARLWKARLTAVRHRKLNECQRKVCEQAA